MLHASASLSLDRLRRELDSLSGMQATDWRVAADMLAPLAGRLLALRRPRAETRPRRAVPAPRAVPQAVSGATPATRLTAVTRNFLLGFVLPLWLAAGIADWLCHRRARIERTGSTESALHLLMLAEAAVPVVAGLLLEITSPVLLLMWAAVAAHAATALWDVSYAVKRREVTPIEQHVHSYLEMVPLMAASFVAVLHWPELRALFGIGRRGPDWSIRRKRTPLPVGLVATLLACMLALEVAPYIEEFRRGRRAGG
jgi:hypothetical protein